MREDFVEQIIRTRVERPEAIAEAAARRRRPVAPVDDTGRVMVVAADHPARGSLGVGARPLAMADRADLLERLCVALERPGVTGVLATADILEDLLLLGVLDDKVVFGSMNRGGLAGASWEIDDRFTSYDAETIEAMGFEGGKMLTRVDLDHPATAPTLEASSRAVNELADRRLVAMVEPFMSRLVDGRRKNDLTTEAAIKASAIAAGLGRTSAYTWLKVPVVDDMERVAGASTLPTVLLGGEIREDQDAFFETWRTALAVPNVIGMVVGRSLLYPADDDVAKAVDAAVGLFPTPAGAAR
ncbi:MAG TPA: deoxyribose-phosphate aldolase [Baekduia sp.]|nr:deoxyribose-phosphate aldolase [Baekduia sp.]